MQTSQAGSLSHLATKMRRSNVRPSSSECCSPRSGGKDVIHIFNQYSTIAAAGAISYPQIPESSVLSTMQMCLKPPRPGVTTGRNDKARKSAIGACSRTKRLGTLRDNNDSPHVVASKPRRHTCLIPMRDTSSFMTVFANTNRPKVRPHKKQLS